MSTAVKGQGQDCRSAHGLNGLQEHKQLLVPLFGNVRNINHQSPSVGSSM